MQIPSVLPRIFCYFCVATRYICFTRTHTHTPTNWKTPRGQHLSASVEPIQKPIDQTTEQKAVRRVQKWNEQKFAIISHIQCNKTRENGYVIYGKQTFIVDCSRVDGSRLVDAIRLTKKITTISHIHCCVCVYHTGKMDKTQVVNLYGSQARTTKQTVGICGGQQHIFHENLFAIFFSSISFCSSMVVLHAFILFRVRVAEPTHTSKAYQKLFSYGSDECKYRSVLHVGANEWGLYLYAGKAGAMFANQLITKHTRCLAKVLQSLYI